MFIFQCNEVKHRPVCTFLVDKVGQTYDIVDIGCDQIHWTVDQEGSTTEVPPPPPSTG